MQKQMFKVLAPLRRHDGTGDWFQRVGSAYRNRDDSINIYLDLVPVPGRDGKVVLQLRQLDEADLRPRALSAPPPSPSSRSPSPSPSSPSPSPSSPSPSSLAPRSATPPST